MKKIISKLTLLALIFSFILTGFGLTVDAAIGTTPTVKYSSTLSSSYYNSVSGLTGDELLENLATLTKSNHKYYTTYDEIRGGNAYSDRDPNNSSNLIDFYTGWSIPNDWDAGATWNREHVWCQSKTNGLFGTTGAGSDIHHIRPLISSINSARNNGRFTDREHSGSYTLTSYYYNGTKVPSYTGKNTGCYNYGQDYWEPRDAVKGDVARILMYVYMHYSTEVSANSSFTYAGALDISNIVYTSTGTDDAAWDMLVDWCEGDPVDSFEANRNNYCASVTGTRNPFIDHPEYANAIWGDGTLSGGSNSDSGDSENDSNNTGSENTGSGNTSSDTTTTITTSKWKMVKTANSITVGSKIVIVAKDYAKALSTNQKTNNRGQTSVSKYTDGTDNLLSPSSTTQIFEVKAGKTSGTYALYTGSGYLCSQSSSENVLRTRSSITGNASWKFNFSSGAAKIVAQGSYTRNVLRYNATSGLFSCYAATNSQKDVAVYKLYTTTTTIFVPSEPEDVYYTVTFNTNGGSVISNQQILEGAKLTAPTDPTKIGYNFAGWYTNTNLTNEYDFTTPVTSNFTLYAKWEEEIIEETYYNVTFNTNGGTQVSNQSVEEGYCALIPNNPTKSGYNFIGWYTNSSLTSQFDFETPITSNITLYAKWEEIVETPTYYTITFNSDGGTSVSNQTILQGNTAMEPLTPEKSGYEFVGWTFNGVIYDFSTPITSNITLLAIWEEIYIAPSDYFVSFDSDGGSDINSQIISNGKYVNIPDNPSKDGYNFIGWLLDGKPYDFATPITEDITLVADWEVNLITGYQVNVNDRSTIRLIAGTVEELDNLLSLGFFITINGETTIVNCNTLYKEISSVVGSTQVNISSESIQCEYLFSYILENIEVNSEIIIQSFVITTDGSISTGSSVNITIE